ncbi:hypothetical protein JD844_013552 [Phrynosoma platyrhinos]|uniref:von Willebrand factor A domain-containing protein 7 n=1 Tax=Phrynosoma platyrhinos TaxID=52577 RepID=A0ABQ7TKZ7_PHRPL|nr:hypothetical protein JD844_013552 [Phrynosoma platyrhinos]
MGFVSGFRPNHESGGIDPGDFTDADITEKGALQAVAWFMETEIIKGNNQVEIHHAEDSSFFFHCGEITKSIAQLRALRKAMLASLAEPVTLAGLEAARLNAGKALHLAVNEDSGDRVPSAPASKATCKDCVKDISGVYTCKDNIRVKDMLVSGYKISATCKTKPQGKCGHGGKDDATQDIYPTGGINKETSDPKLSPHADLHKKAAELAIRATKEFFVEGDASLLSEVGEDIFRKFFNLEGYSLTFVIDTTSSMTEDIAQVKEKCMEILQNFSDLPDTPFNYILVPFNDPDYGPAFKTQNVNELKSYISKLTVDGGGDCPEMSLSGLKVALDDSLPSFTDAGSKDEDLKEEIKIKVDTTLSEVNYVLTGSCDSRKRRSITKRITRAAEKSYENIYEEIAAYSGGYYVMTSKSELSRVLGIMELSLNAAPVKVARARLDGTRFSFPVDETLTEITVSMLGDTEGAKLKRLVAVSELGTPMWSASLNQTSDALGNVLAVASVPFDAPTSLLSIEGLSPSNLPFSRINTNPIRTESVQIMPLPGQKVSMSPGETLEVSVLVVNDGPAAWYTFKVWDDLSLLRSFTPTTHYLKPGQNTNLTAIFAAPVGQDKFATSTATFSAQSSAAQNYLKLPITVIPETALETDTTPPVYNLVQLKMPCAEDSQHQPDCSRLIWRITFFAKDDHSDVSVKVSPNPSGVSCHPSGTDGDKDIICDYKSNCCTPFAEILVSDGKGNADAFTVDYNTTLPTAAR